jgi:hypothetical protein
MKRGFIMIKAKKIIELENKIKELNKKLEEAERVITGEKHIPGVHCVGCANLVENEEYSVFEGRKKVKYCKLDFKCADRVEKGN